MATESIKPGPDQSQETEGKQTPEVAAEKPVDVLATIERVGSEVFVRMNEARRRIEQAGGRSEDLAIVDREFAEGIAEAKRQFLEEAENYKTTWTTPEHLVSEGSEVKIGEQTILERQKTETSAKEAISPEAKEMEEQEITIGSMVTRPGWDRPGKVWKVDENNMVFIEGVANSVPLSELQLAGEEEVEAVAESPMPARAETVQEQAVGPTSVGTESEEKAPTTPKAPTAEIPKVVLNQFSPDNRNLIQKLPEKSWQLLREKILKTPIFLTKIFTGRIAHKALKDTGEVHRRYGFIGSRIGVLFNSVLIDRQKSGWIRHGTSLEGLQGKFDKADSIVAEYESQIAELDRQERELAETAGVSSSEKLKFEHAREKIRQKIYKARNRREAFRHRTEEVGVRINRYEARRQVIAENLSRRVESRLNPLNQRTEKINVAKGKLEAEVQELEMILADKKARFEDLRNRMSESPNLRRVLKSRSRELAALIKKAEKMVADRQAKIRNFDRQTSLLNERINPYKEMQSGFQNFIKNRT